MRHQPSHCILSAATFLATTFLVAALHAEPAGHMAPSHMQVRMWVKQLDDDSFQVRENAQKNLREISRPDGKTLGALTAAVTGQSAEGRTRALRLAAGYISRADVELLSQWKQTPEAAYFYKRIDHQIDKLRTGQRAFEAKVERAILLLRDPRRTTPDPSDLRMLPVEVRLLGLDFRGRDLRFLPEYADDLQHAKVLTIYKCQISAHELGKLLKAFTAVRELELQHCTLETLPPEIGELQRLRSLRLPYNQLKSLPPEVGKLTALTQLHAGGNQITGLPDEISNLQNLNSLHLLGNQFQQFPTQVCDLRNLESLSFGSPEVSKLPASMGNLTKLKNLYLGDCSFGTWPSVLNELSSLQSLTVHDCQLKNVSPGIHRLTSLQRLGLSRNKIPALPPQIGECAKLTYLNLEHNHLVTLPPEIAKLTALSSLDLAYNYFRAVPSVLAQLDSVKKLYLNAFPAAEPDVAILREMASLRELTVPRNSLTEQRYRQMRKSLPGCKLRRAFR